MNDTNTLGYDERPPGPGMPGQPQPPGVAYPEGYRFSPEELGVLKECNRESFFQRSLPLAAGMGFTAYVAIQKGHLKPNPRFGALPKVTLAVVMGYFVGKLSYQEACAEKLMALPGSYIGQLLRERKEGKSRNVNLKKQPPNMFGAGPNDIYSDAGPGNSLDLDTDRPIFSDDSFRPDNTPMGSGQPDVKVNPVLTYEELRRRNRGEYSDAKQDPYKVDPNAIPPMPRRPMLEPQPQPEPKSTNKYGDEMD